MSFFLCRLTDPALTEGFSDYSNLIAWGETFPSNYLCVCLGLLGVSLRPTNGGDSPRTALGDTAGPREGQWQPGGEPPRLYPCSGQAFRTSPAGWMLPAVVLLPCCMPWGALERLDPLTHPPFGTGSVGSTGSAGSQASPRWPRRSLVAKEVLSSHLCCTGVQPG